jgi:1-deoxy-D-xylulose-5-phosphate reductoisomerase
MRHICILGSTGSIGENTLDVISNHPELFKVEALSANTQVEKLAKQCHQFVPKLAVIESPQLAEKLERLLEDLPTRVVCGPSGLLEAVLLHEVDTVMAAIVGAAGLLPTIEAAKAGKRVLLANKEALVMSGQILIDATKKSGAELLPIDSEHNAIFQCLPEPNSLSEKKNLNGVEELLLTASGGPFLNRTIESLENVSPEEACAHPNWSMGKKISVDSATMMNKGLELIEAMWLFNMPEDKIQIVIHPQSVIHSLVRYADGSLIAQLGAPDMRTPIAYGLGWPNRISSGVKQLDLTQISQLSFREPNLKLFPAILLAREAARLKGTTPAILNAANEIAVESFLKGQIRYTQIVSVVDQVLQEFESKTASDLETILEADKLARNKAQNIIKLLL